MTIKYHNDLIQGSEEWIAARCGLLTASEMKLIMTPTLKKADNDNSRKHLYELLAQRVTQYVEPTYIGDNMLRGKEEEIEARIVYSENYEPVQEVGFVTNDEWGFTIGYSPDGLVGEDGLIEAKSRKQKFQIEVIINQKLPDEHILQTQTGLLVTRRKWCDYISYSGGMYMAALRIYPDPVIQEAIVNCAGQFEKTLAEKLAAYHEIINNPSSRLIMTKRREIQEITV